MSERKNGVQVWDLGNTLVAFGATWAFKPGASRADYADQYATNPINAERDYGCNPPDAVESAMVDKSAVRKMANPHRVSPVDEEGGYSEDFMGDPAFEYYCHIDMSKVNDPTGMAICHYNVETDKVEIDLIDTKFPQKGWNLSFERIFALIMTWKELGFRFKRITFDQWQSYNMIERLINAGIPAELYSVDRGTEAYDTLIEALLTGRLDFYYQGQFDKEMQELKLYKGNKYDHPPLGSKDTSDAVAGCVAQCIKDRVGLALKASEIDASVHDEHILSITKTRLPNDTVFYDIDDSEIDTVERTRKRLARIDVNDHNLVLLFGWFDKHNDCLHVDEYLVWEGLDQEETTARLKDFLLKLCRCMNVEVFSLNEYVPLDVVNFLKEMGRRISSPLMSRGGLGHKAANRVASTSPVNDNSIGVVVSQLKKGNLTIPHHPYLIKDLKFMTHDNMRYRPYVKALAAWADFASKEVSFGRTSVAMPRVRSAMPAPINPVMGKMTSAVPSQRSGNQDIDRLRQKYNLQQTSAPVAKEDHPGQPRRMPRLRPLRR